MLIEEKIELPDQEQCFIDVGGRKITYYLSRSVEDNKPILFILHGHGYAEKPAKFKSRNWNVVCPMDFFGEDGYGSWYLGERGDFFWIDAIKLIIDQVREKTGKGRLYFWGSSMGGYGAILHGYLNHAMAIYANIPQTVLLGSKYSESGMRKYFEPIFSDDLSEYNDLKNLIKARNRTKFFLCFNQLEGGDYFREQGLDFISHVHALRQKIYLEVRPLASHGKNHGVSEAIELFKKFND